MNEYTITMMNSPKPKNVPDLSDNLLTAIEDKKLREKSVVNAWKTAQEYDWLNIAKKIQNIYEIVLNR